MLIAREVFIIIASFDDKIWDKIEIYQAIYNDEIANKLKNENE